jgi:hypothetical protein
MLRRDFVLMLLAAALRTAVGQTGSENRRPMPPTSPYNLDEYGTAKYLEDRKHILFLGANHYYAHYAVSKAMYTMEKLGEQSGLFDVTFRTDFRLVTKKTIPNYLNANNLNNFDAVMLFTQGDLSLTDDQKADLVSFVRDDGKGLLVAHSGTDINRWKFVPSKDKDKEPDFVIEDTGGWPELIEMVGGVFIDHPWAQEVRVNVEDRGFVATKHFPPSFKVNDEIYELTDFSRDKIHVLMSLDAKSVDFNHPSVDPVTRTDKDFPIARVHKYGKGRVIACTLGHMLDTWDRPDIEKMWLEAAKWVLNLV